LIKYATEQDIWFHVDSWVPLCLSLSPCWQIDLKPFEYYTTTILELSSPHVYLRLPRTITSWESIPLELANDIGQLVKAGSIQVELSHSLSLSLSIV